MADDRTPDHDEAVRRLLADARETGPMPPEVAARLDAALADLAAGAGAHPTEPDAPEPDPTEPDPTGPATVTPLHRRRWPRVLLAAAAVTVVGLGSAQLVDRGGDAARDTAGAEAEVADDRVTLREAPDSDDGAAGSAEDAQRDSTDAPESGNLEGQRGPARADGQGPFPTPVTLPGLDRALLADELAPVGRLREVGVLADEPSSGPASSRLLAAKISDWRCGPLYAVPDGSAYLSLERKGALVVAHPPANGVRLVEVYDCRGEDPRRSTTVVTLTVPE